MVNLTERMSSLDRIFGHGGIRNAIFVLSHHSKVILFAQNQISDSVEVSGNVVANLRGKLSSLHLSGKE